MSKPYQAEASSTRFFIPPTLQSDFDNFLDTDIPNTVMNFEVRKDWYSDESTTIRGELYPDDTKSRYTNTDNYLNFRTSLSADVRKGDILTDENQTIYLLDWSIAPESNNKPSRLFKCNFYCTITRLVEDEVDDDGYLKQEGGEQIICDRMPCNIYQYDGRPDYAAQTDSPGLVPNVVAVMTTQYNSRTKNVKIHDKFLWGDTVYEIVDVDRIGLAMDEQSGTIVFQAKKKAGGMVG